MHIEEVGDQVVASGVDVEIVFLFRSRIFFKILGQLSTRNWHCFAVFGRGCIQSVSNIFSDMTHIVAFPRWPPLTLKFPHG